MFGKKQIIVMITVTAAVLAAVAVVLLTLPKAPSVTPSGEPSSSAANAFAPIIGESSSSTADTSEPIFGEQVTFTATVLNVREGAVLVHANGALCWVRTTVQRDVPVPSLKIGDGIQVVHNGVVAESYPGQINFVYKIRKLDKAPTELSYTLTPKDSMSSVLTLVTDTCDLGGAIYYYAFDGMDVAVDGEKMSLQHALAVGIVSPQYLLEQAEKDAKSGKCQSDLYDDGGSKLYRYESYAFLKMNTTDGDKTLYIGTTDMTMSVISNVRANKNDPLIKIAVSQDEQGKPKRVSTWRTAMETDYIIYFVDIDSVRVRVGDEYRDILDAIHGELIDVDTLRSDLFTLAQKDGTVICADGLRDGISYTETTMRFDGFTVTFTGYQNRREVFFSAPNTGGFTQNAKERIAEESPKYPLSVVENDDPMPYKITKAAWKLNYDVYYTGIDRATVTVNGKSMDLIKAVDSGLLTFDELVEDAARLEKNGLIRVDTIKDGGSKKYRFDGYIIFKKHHMNGDRSLYIEKIR